MCSCDAEKTLVAVTHIIYPRQGCAQQTLMLISEAVWDRSVSSVTANYFMSAVFGRLQNERN